MTGIASAFFLIINVTSSTEAENFIVLLTTSTSFAPI